MSNAPRSRFFDPRFTSASQNGQPLFYVDWDWGAAEREFKRAIELDPANVEAHIWTKRLRRRMGRAVWVGYGDWEGLAVERFWCDTFGFPAVVAGVPWPSRTKGYHMEARPGSGSKSVKPNSCRATTARISQPRRVR